VTIGWLFPIHQIQSAVTSKPLTYELHMQIVFRAAILPCPYPRYFPAPIQSRCVFNQKITRLEKKYLTWWWIFFLIWGCLLKIKLSYEYTDFEIRFSVLIEMFVTSISFRGTFKSFWDLTGKSAILVQSALLCISQPDFQNQSIELNMKWHGGTRSNWTKFLDSKTFPKYVIG